MVVHQGISSNAWPGSGTKTNKWKEGYTYDANGNIITLRRYADNSAVMDSLTYNYNANTNRLAYVDDVVGSGTFSVDVDDQAAANYTYDAVGNLISDNAEGIDAIYWNVYGKIDSIKRDASSNKQHP